MLQFEVTLQVTKVLNFLLLSLLLLQTTLAKIKVKIRSVLNAKPMQLQLANIVL